VKIATFAKPKTVSGKASRRNTRTDKFKIKVE
jgi:hypothetical protein